MSNNLNRELHLQEYWIISDDEDEPPVAMFREKFDALQWQYLHCPNGKIESFKLIVKK